MSTLLPRDTGGQPIISILYRWKRIGRYHTYTHDPWEYKVDKTFFAADSNHNDKSTSSSGMSEKWHAIIHTLHNVVPNATLLIEVAAKTTEGISEWSEPLTMYEFFLFICRIIS